MGIRAVNNDCDRTCDDRIACRLTSHTLNSLIGRDAANVGCSLDSFSSPGASSQVKVMWKIKDGENQAYSLPRKVASPGDIFYPGLTSTLGKAIEGERTFYLVAKGSGGRWLASYI